MANRIPSTASGPESNDFLIDGASNFNAVDGGFVLKPPIDAIAEFKILTHTADAEFGGASGSTTNIVTRSGSNHLHGDVWEFVRNDAVDASNFFENADGLPKSEYRQNQFGATLGGPIRLDKTFFFGYYEGFRNRQGETLSHVRVPSVLERQGDFSQDVAQDGPLLNLFALGGPAPVPGNKVPGIDPPRSRCWAFTRSPTPLIRAACSTSITSARFCATARTRPECALTTTSLPATL